MEHDAQVGSGCSDHSEQLSSKSIERTVETHVI